MLRKMTIRSLVSAGLLLLFAAPPLVGQGVLRQEYTGLDKYPEQGRPESASFVGVRAAEFLAIPVGARGIAWEVLSWLSAMISLQSGGIPRASVSSINGR